MGSLSISRLLISIADFETLCLSKNTNRYGYKIVSQAKLQDALCWGQIGNVQSLTAAKLRQQSAKTLIKDEEVSQRMYIDGPGCEA